jgi:hypothetical protein
MNEALLNEIKKQNLELQCEIYDTFENGDIVIEHGKNS